MGWSRGYAVRATLVGSPRVPGGGSRVLVTGGGATAFKLHAGMTNW